VRVSVGRGAFIAARIGRTSDLGQSLPARFASGRPDVRMPPIATRILQRRDWSLWAEADILQRENVSTARAEAYYANWHEWSASEQN
jgi:hypothetical protein